MKKDVIFYCIRSYYGIFEINQKLNKITLLNTYTEQEVLHSLLHLLHWHHWWEHLWHILVKHHVWLLMHWHHVHLHLLSTLLVHVEVHVEVVVVVQLLLWHWHHWQHWHLHVHVHWHLSHELLLLLHLWWSNEGLLRLRLHVLVTVEHALAFNLTKFAHVAVPSVREVAVEAALTPPVAERILDYLLSVFLLDSVIKILGVNVSGFLLADVSF